jgi:hypothetical protein
MRWDFIMNGTDLYCQVHETAAQKILVDILIWQKTQKERSDRTLLVNIQQR